MNYTVMDLIILNHTYIGSKFTTQSITESIYGCKKGDQTYRKYVDDVATSLQKLAREGVLTKKRMDTGHGYAINEWERIL